MFVHSYEMMDSIKIHYITAGIKIYIYIYKIFFLAISSFILPVLSLTQSVKLQVGSCDCSTDFTQCNYCSDTRTERYKEKKRPYRLLALNTGRNQTESQCVISRPIKPHQEQQGGKCFTSSSHSLTFVENYSN